jgi:hypothetical protein
VRIAIGLAVLALALPALAQQQDYKGPSETGARC